MTRSELAATATATGAGWALVAIVVLAIVLIPLARYFVPPTRGFLEVIVTEANARRTVGELLLRWWGGRVRSGSTGFETTGADVAIRARGVRRHGRPAVRVHATVRPHADGPLAGPVRRATVDVPEQGRRLVLGLEVMYHATSATSRHTDPGAEPAPDESRTDLLR